MDYNKRGKTSPVMWIIAIGVIALLAVAITYGVVQTMSPSTEENVGEIISSTGCENDPTIDVNAVNALDLGTTVTVTSSAIVDGTYIGEISSSDTFQKGADVVLLVNATDYIDQEVEVGELACGQNSVNVKMFNTDSVTMDLWEKGNDLTDTATGGAVNATSIAEGGSQTYDLYITGTDKYSTGDLVYVLEFSVTQNVSDSGVVVQKNGATLDEEEIPSFYTDTLTSPFKKAFLIPATTGAGEQAYTMTVTAKSGKKISGALYTTGYSKQAFVDTDGTIVYGVEDSDGTTKYEDTSDVDAFIAIS